LNDTVKSHKGHVAWIKSPLTFSSRFAQALGFETPSISEMKVLIQWTGRHILPMAAITFGRGSHSSLNLVLKFASPLDVFAARFVSHVYLELRKVFFLSFMVSELLEASYP
jgi:hypothetical protein